MLQRFLPILRLNAQPVFVGAFFSSKADAGNGGEGFQTTCDDGLFTGGWQSNTSEHSAFPTAQESNLSLNVQYVMCLHEIR